MGSAGVAPQRESVMGSGMAANAVVPHPAAGMMARPVVSKSSVPPAPVSFAAKQQALQANGGRPLAPEQVQQIRSQQLANSTATPANRPVDRPVNRMDSRPPSAARPVPAAPESKPAPENRPAPAAAQRPSTESRPAPAAENKPAPANDKKAPPKKAKKTEKEKP